MSSLTTSEAEKEELLLPCIDSTAVMAVTLFSEHITRPFCLLHNKIFELVDDVRKRLVAIAAPRGFGKTTLMGLCFPARLALFRHVHYIVYISATATEAAAKVKILAQELQYNMEVRALFGDVKGVKWAEEKGEIELSDAEGPFCFIQAKGAGSQVRGLKWKRWRPGLFIVDDLEDKEDAQNEENRKKLKKWFFGSLLGAMDNSEFSDSRLVMIGTIVHEDSLLANLIDEKTEIVSQTLDLDDDTKEILERSEKFHILRLEACDDNYESLWPDFISTKALRAKAEAYKQRGLLDIFFMEYRNIVIAAENASFQQSMFKYYEEGSEDSKEELKGCETVILVDPAKTSNVASAFSAIIAVGFNARLNRIYFRDCVNAKLTPDKIYEAAVLMADRFKAIAIGIEVTGLNDFISYPFRQYLNQQQRFHELVEIKATKDKAMRIAALVPFYRMGCVYHNQAIHVRGALEAQLLSFPYSKYWDVMDVFANIIPMFSLGERDFTYQLEKPETYETIEDEYEMLREMDAHEDAAPNWRII